MSAWSWRWRGFGLGVSAPHDLGRRLATRVGRSAPLLVNDGATPKSVVHRDAAATVDTMPGLRIYPEQGLWYHTIELSDGEVTSGTFDHRPLVPHYGIPENLTGKRALDVATADGFWAFEFERRGAEVTATDVSSMADLGFPPAVREEIKRQGLDRPVGEGFEKARKALGSTVRKVQLSVYDLSPETVGSFDLVHSGDVLLHVEKPLSALRAIRSVTSGKAIIVDTFDPTLTGMLTRYDGGWGPRHCEWWVPSLDLLVQLVVDAGFSAVRVHKTYSLPVGGPWRAIIMAEP